MTRFLVGFVAALLLAVPLAGCGGNESESQADSIIDRVQDATDRAQRWIDENRQTARDIEQMWREYRNGDLARAATVLDSLRTEINWEEGLLANEELRNHLLEGGTQVYEQLGRPQEARRLLEDALPHLDGEARQRWEETLRQLEQNASDEPVPAER